MLLHAIVEEDARGSVKGVEETNGLLDTFMAVMHLSFREAKGGQGGGKGIGISFWMITGYG